MSNKKGFSAKTVSILLVLVLMVGLAAGGTVAWLVDKSPEVVNTFTYGDINIDLKETDSDNDGDVTKNTYEMVPGRQITKDPTVTVETGSEANWLFVKLVKSGGTTEYDFDDYLTYAIADGWTALAGEEGVYYREVAEDATVRDFAVLKDNKVTVKSEVTKEMVNALGTDPATATYPQLTVVAYAVQRENMDTAADAWAVANGTYTSVTVSTSDALEDAIENAGTGKTTLNLTYGEFETNVALDGGKNIVIVGSGEANTTLKGQIATTSSDAGTLTLKNMTINVDDSIVDSTGISQTGKSAIAIWGNQTVICENVTFNMTKADSTAITSWWDTNEGTTIIVKNCTFNCNGQRPIRATGNVTVEKCTFNDPYRYAVQLTAKASTATLLDKATINFNNNTIVNGANGKPFVYGIQLEGEEYGCNDCVINGSGNIITDGGADSAMYYCECGKVDHTTIEWNTEVAAVHGN